MRLIAKALLSLAFMASGAGAGENTANLPTGLGHPPDHQAYFDGTCCNNRDCEMVPDTAVTETDNDYQVRYWTSNYGGRLVEGVVPRAQVRMSKKCLDGFCTGVCSYPTSNGKASVRCLYIMPNT